MPSFWISRIGSAQSLGQNREAPFTQARPHHGHARILGRSITAPLGRDRLVRGAPSQVSQSRYRVPDTAPAPDAADTAEMPTRATGWPLVPGTSQASSAPAPGASTTGSDATFSVSSALRTTLAHSRQATAPVAAASRSNRARTRCPGCRVGEARSW